MKIAIVQTEAIKGNIEKNLINHLNWLKKAILYKADMVVFPELSLTGYEADLAAKLAINKDDKRLDELQSLSDQNDIIIGVGVPTKDTCGLLISMIIFQPHMKRISYSKQYLYPGEEFNFKSGRKPLVLNIKAEVVAPAICYETANKAHQEFAKQENATIYIASVLCSVNGIAEEHHRLSCIAKENKFTTFMSNYVGKSGGYDCAGKSSVWDENGELVAQLGNKDEGIIIYDTASKEVRLTPDI